MNKIFCPHAYNALEITTSGLFKSCCVSQKRFVDNDGNHFHAATHSISDVYNSEDRKNWVNNFDEHFETDCKQCFQVEQGGGESKRLREINYWQGVYNPDPVPYMDTNRELEVLDLKLGNTCNLACATCHPDSSSKWNSIYKQQTGSFGWPQQHWQDSDKFWEGLIREVSKVKKIEIAGGEPFMNKKQKLLINYLVDNDIAKNIDVTWITNCTFYEEDIVEKFKHFKFVRVMISIDNTHEQFEFMRYPAKWKDSYQIFLKFKKLQEQGLIELGISHTIGLLNIYHLPEFWQFAREHQVPVFNNLVMNPFSAQDLPIEFKHTVRKKLEAVTDPSYQSNPAAGPNNWLVEFMMKEKNELAKALTHLEFVKQSRPGLFEKAFPELIEILK